MLASEAFGPVSSIMLAPNRAGGLRILNSDFSRANLYVDFAQQSDEYIFGAVPSSLGPEPQRHAHLHLGRAQIALCGAARLSAVPGRLEQGPHRARRHR